MGVPRVRAEGSDQEFSVSVAEKKHQRSKEFGLLLVDRVELPGRRARRRHRCRSDRRDRRGGIRRGPHERGLVRQQHGSDRLLHVAGRNHGLCAGEQLVRDLDHGSESVVRTLERGMREELLGFGVDDLELTPGLQDPIDHEPEFSLALLDLRVRDLHAPSPELVQPETVEEPFVHPVLDQDDDVGPHERIARVAILDHLLRPVAELLVGDDEQRPQTVAGDGSGKMKQRMLDLSIRMRPREVRDLDAEAHRNALAHHRWDFFEVSAGHVQRDKPCRLPVLRPKPPHHLIDQPLDGSADHAQRIDLSTSLDPFF